MSLAPQWGDKNHSVHFEVAGIKKNKTGKTSTVKLPESDLRKHCISVRLNTEEMAMIEEQVAKTGMYKGEFLRCSGLYDIKIVPEINRQVCTELGRIGVNLNQIARKLNQGQNIGMDELLRSLAKLRQELMGVTLDES